MKLWSQVKDSRYWRDAEYRERKRRTMREVRARCKQDPTYRRKRYLENAITQKRGSIAFHQAFIDKQVAEIVTLQRELTKVRQQWNARPRPRR